MAADSNLGGLHNLRVFFENVQNPQSCGHNTPLHNIFQIPKGSSNLHLLQKQEYDPIMSEKTTQKRLKISNIRKNYLETPRSQRCPYCHFYCTCCISKLPFRFRVQNYTEAYRCDQNKDRNCFDQSEAYTINNVSNASFYWLKSLGFGKASSQTIPYWLVNRKPIFRNFYEDYYYLQY